MGATETEWWMGEPTMGLHEIDDHLRSLDTLASPQSFGVAAYPQLARVDDDYADDGSRFNATVGDATEAGQAGQPPMGQAPALSTGATVAIESGHICIEPE